MSRVAFPIAVAFGLALFGRTLWQRFRLMRAARPVSRFDHLGERTKRTLLYAFGQKKFIEGEQPAGWMHAFIFWGFMLLGLTVVTLFGRAFDEGWNVPLFAPGDLLGGPYLLLRDIMEVTVLIAVTYALYRRLVAHTPRLFGFRPAEDRLAGEPHWEGILILMFIAGIMLSGLLYEGGRLAHLAGEHTIEKERDWAPVSNLVSKALPDSAALSVSDVAWWVHNLIVLTFLNLLPLSKHFHIITAIPNVFFGKLPPRGASRTLPGAAQALVPGVARMDAPLPKLEVTKVPGTAAGDFTWKQVLDMFSCTECGRCSSACPATAAGTPLAPRQFILDLRDFTYGRTDGVANGGGTAKAVSSEVLWSCTTCMACVEACPVGIEHVPSIVQMRRDLVDQGDMEPLLQTTLQNFAQQGNSYGKSSRMRARWTKGLDFQIPDARKEPVEYLWFVGDFASFDERSQEASRRVAQILNDAGVSFGLLYEGERNAGNDVRRVGEEGLFEMLVEQNMEVFGTAEFQAIFTTDPHSLNTLRNEYPEFGLDKPVYHYTELLGELVANGTIELRTPISGTRVTYHDPCYLARYNRITDAPRKLIAATGAELVEMPRHGTNTFCCGAGGGRIWMDDSSQTERPSEQRIKEAQALGDIQYFVVSCPKDLAMYSDAAKTVGADMEVVELTALVEQAMARAETLAGVGAGTEGAEA